MLGLGIFLSVHFIAYFTWTSYRYNLRHVLNADRLALIRQQRADAAKKREEEKTGTSAAIYISLHV
jgi:hypothetical protein